MKLLTLFFAILALSVAETIEKNEEAVEDLEAAAASVELTKTRKETLESAASTYNSYVPPSQITPKAWGQNVPSPPQSNYVPPQNYYGPPQNYPAPPQKYPAPPHNNYYPTKPTWVPNTAVTVIKNEQYIGQNGSYRYEYKLSDGTWVFEEGYTLYPGTAYQNVVKNGWYSFRATDGKVYTVTWWADNSGYHAFGDHLPRQPSTLPADGGQQAEAVTYKPLYTTVTPLPTYTTHQPPTYPQPSYPQPTYPQPTYPQPTYPQPTYPHNNYHVNQPHPYATK